MLCPFLPGPLSWLGFLRPGTTAPFIHSFNHAGSHYAPSTVLSAGQTGGSTQSPCSPRAYRLRKDRDQDTDPCSQRTYRLRKERGQDVGIDTEHCSQRTYHLRKERGQDVGIDTEPCSQRTYRLRKERGQDAGPCKKNAGMLFGGT